MTASLAHADATASELLGIKSQTRSYQVAAPFEVAELSKKFSWCCWGGL
jgi:hypothetical protein